MLLQIFVRQLCQVEGGVPARDVPSFLDARPRQHLGNPAAKVCELADVDAGPVCSARPVSPRSHSWDGGPRTMRCHPAPAGDVGNGAPIPDQVARVGFAELPIQNTV